MSDKRPDNFFIDTKQEDDVIPPPEALQRCAHVGNLDQYRELYNRSINQPEKFWGEIAKDFYWQQPPSQHQFCDYNFDIRKGPIKVEWMKGARTNLCYNALDRNVERGLGEKVAFYWEGNDPNDSFSITYNKLLCKVCKFANFLRSKGIRKGDCVAVYLPMIIQLPIAMLACARIGAPHSVIFGGFSAAALAARMLDTKASLLVTADAVWRGTKMIRLKTIADEAIEICAQKGHKIHTSVVVSHLAMSNEQRQEMNGDVAIRDGAGVRPVSDLKITWNDVIDIDYQTAVNDQPTTCETEWLDSEDPLFMLYTSGSTGKPKGVLHTQSGYMLYTATTFKYTFNYENDDIYFCTADIGWITGHSYVVYGPLTNGATGVIFEGVPFFPDASRYWQIIEKYSVTKFYTAPTAIRSLMKFGDEFVTKCNRSSLKILGTVGEPINPEAWWWYYKVVGDSKCSIVDTYWQTETGGHVITPLPGCTPMKPGSACMPFFGVQVALLSEDGSVVEGEGEGYLVFSKPWPGLMRTVFGDHARFEKTYFSRFPGYYCSGDGARRDSDGYIWITGRIDDMMNVSGHLLSTAEIESALVEHPAVAEAAVVASPHDIKGEIPYAFITLKNDQIFTPDLVKELKLKVRQKIGPVAIPEIIQNAPGLPKTRSGKIMRRVLRKVAVNDRDLGDVSTLADSNVLSPLYELRPGEED